MNPEGLVPTFLVFSALPRFPEILTDLSHQLDLRRSLNVARQEAETVFSKFRTTQALKYKESVVDMENLQAGSNVSIHHEKENFWS